MPALFSTLIEKAQTLGARGPATPMDVLEIAKELAQHPDARANLADLVALVEDPKNYYARWAGIRVISLLGPAAVHRHASLFRQRLALEDFDLARRELENALAKIEQFAK
jgi:hypothetical protein